MTRNKRHRRRSIRGKNFKRKGQKPRLTPRSRKKIGKVKKAANRVRRGLVRAGWWVSIGEVARAGSAYIKVRRDGVNCVIRISDHDTEGFNRPREGLLAFDPTITARQAAEVLEIYAAGEWR